MGNKTNTYADIMLDRINQCVDQKTKNLSIISGAVVNSVNTDGTINVYLPPDKNKVFTNISNQTPFSLKQGDSVELLLKDGSYNNCWIIAKHQTTYNGAAELSSLMEQYATLDDLQKMQASLKQAYMKIQRQDQKSTYKGLWLPEIMRISYHRTKMP